MKKVLVYFLTFIFVQLACSAVIGAIWSSFFTAGMTAGRIIVMSSAASIITTLIFVISKWTPFSRDFMQDNPWVLIYWSVIIALGMIIPSQFLEDLLPQELTKDILSNEIKMVMANNWGYLAVGLLAPLTEELVFRGAIQKVAVEYFEKKFSAAKNLTSEASILRKNMPHWTGVIFTAMLFAAVHGNPAQMPHALLVGMLLGWMCYRSGSIVPGIVVHWVNNTVAFVSCAMYPETYDMKIADLFGNEPLRIALAIAFSLMLLVPAVYQYHLRTKKENIERRDK